MTDITTRFPECIGFGSSGGPNYSTDVVTAASGVVEANSNWSYPLHTYNVATGIHTTEDMEQFLRFFHAAAGRAYTFPFKDRNDYKSCSPADTPAQTDQTLGTATASQTDFQIIKTYTEGGISQVRQIRQPISGTVLVEVDAVLQTETADYTINYTTGVITFVTPMAGGEIVKAGYEFDVPCRFGTDAWAFVLEQKQDEDAFLGGGTCTISEDRQ